jgi:hypothetical protein
VSPYQIYAVGLQKSGSSIMIAAIGEGLHVDYNTEAILSCCCEGGAAAEEMEDTSMYPSHYARQTCVNDENLAAPLFCGDTRRYAKLCAPSLQQSTVLKADDMLWQVHELIDYFWSLPPHAPTSGMQFIFYVRHPLFNIRSLLAWCAPAIGECGPSLRDEEERGRNNTLYRRVFSDRSGAIAASPLELARTWKRAANVYLRAPSSFAACVPAHPPRAVPHAAVLGRHQRGATTGRAHGLRPRVAATGGGRAGSVLVRTPRRVRVGRLAVLTSLWCAGCCGSRTFSKIRRRLCDTSTTPRMVRGCARAARRAVQWAC